MREIKFRGFGKDEKGKHWIYGNLLDEKLIGLVAVQDEKCHVWEVDPESVGQFTGLKDSEGREIYEGDIVQLDGWDKPTVVMWDDRSGMYIVDRDLIFSHVHKFSKVIGNVHENPELLEQKP